jgi:hypothetical protein
MSEEEANKVTLRELIRAEFTSVRGEIKASSDMSKLAFKSLKNDIEVMHGKQDFTNGRVNELESDMKQVQKIQNSCPVHIIKEKDKEQDNKIQDLEKQTELIKFFEKRPKLFRLLIIAMFWTVLFSMIISFIAINEKVLPFINQLIK